LLIFSKWFIDCSSSSKKDIKDIFYFHELIKIFLVNLVYALIIAVDAKSILMAISLSKARKISDNRLFHLPRFVSIICHGLTLVICVENNQTFLDLFCSE
jgi:hypothetical protein